MGPGRVAVRFVLEGGVLISVAAVLYLLEESAVVVVAALAATFALAIATGVYASRRARPAEAGLRPAPEVPLHVHVLDPEHEPVADEPEPERAAAGSESVEHAPAPARARGCRGRRLKSWPTEPKADPPPIVEREAGPVGAATAVLPSEATAGEHRRWNVWELDRLARESAGADAARDEERALLLLHLRTFAGPDGLLPTSFDDLVCESFGDLVEGREAA